MSIRRGEGHFSGAAAITEGSEVIGPCYFGAGICCRCASVAVKPRLEFSNITSTVTFDDLIGRLDGDHCRDGIHDINRAGLQRGVTAGIGDAVGHRVGTGRRGIHVTGVDEDESQARVAGVGGSCAEFDIQGRAFDKLRIGTNERDDRSDVVLHSHCRDA